MAATGTTLPSRRVIQLASVVFGAVFIVYIHIWIFKMKQLRKMHVMLHVLGLLSNDVLPLK